MNSSLYAKLAATNIRKNAKNYVPYILTCLITIMMFYMMCFLAKNTALRTMSGGDSLIMILGLGTVVIGIFAVIFLFYTNSFLIKRRKKEIGLYNILGMEKKHIAKVLAFESFYVAVLSISLGLSFGILLSKLMVLALGKMLSFKISFGFEISGSAVVTTLILFAAIFVLLLLNNLRQIHLANPIELLRGKQVGEKEPKTKWILALIGLVCLSGGYYISITTKSPLDAIGLFFIAVILVIIGTYCVFTAGSIAVLKVLRKNKRYYYKVNHFISVSGMIYRMKQNAVGLANICILSTMVLVMISSTVSLYIGFEDSLKAMYPWEIQVTGYDITKDEGETIEEVIKEITDSHQLEQKEIVTYRYMYQMAKQEGNQFLMTDADTYVYNDGAVLYMISLEDYNRLLGETNTLKPDEVFVYYTNNKLTDDTISFGKENYHIKAMANASEVNLVFSPDMVETYYIILPDKDAFAKINHELGNVTEDINRIQYFYGFNTDAPSEKQLAVFEDILALRRQADVEPFQSLRIQSSEYMRSEFLFLYGGLFFLGIFLGTLFLMATVLIMYYKQISEGNDDRERFEIMQKVGMSQEEVKKTIHSQVLMVFFLPIVAAAIHIAFAFNVITKLLAIFNLTNIALFATCTLVTLGVFIVFYALVYTLTARTYYRIVKQ
ncbi:ABC transporter permease [Lachnoclostridium phytofermentans]|uniref:ABC transporter permease n=1 Tax=Lachnoclostridium phytofermentans TaxID=66219 RepID=UPI0004964933|nr:ABC transporter permease [Lachnoclostridium phytofermentans]